MYLKQLMAFFVQSRDDHRVGPHHVALYVALFQQWCMAEGKNPVQVTPQQLKQLAKLGRTTYHKCMHELHEAGYIKYVPSFSAVMGSLVYLKELPCNDEGAVVIP